MTINSGCGFSLFFDGASKGNPGKGSYGGALYKDNTLLFTYCNIIDGDCTNNYAEYSGLLHGLQYALKYNITTIKVYGDSQLILRQMTGQYQVKSETLRPLYEKCKELESYFELIQFEHIPRNENSLADSLANQALDLNKQITS